MLDSRIRPIIDIPLNNIGKKLAMLGVQSNHVTILGFVFGIVAMYQIVIGQFSIALLFFVLNRFCDGVDGAVGFLDIVCDFIIYSGIVLAFAINDNSKSLAAAFLIFCFVGPITSFLSYAIIAAKREISTKRRGVKSFYYLGGICEGTETSFILALMCVKPGIFSSICLVYGILCLLTTLGRTYAAYTDFN